LVAWVERVWKILALTAGMSAIAVPGHAQGHAQIPCPVLLVSGRKGRDTIELSFLNKGKVPIQQVSVGCSPPNAGQARDSICHTESGLFYPGSKYTIKFAYTGARRGAVTLSVKGARLGNGELWMARNARACRPLMVRRK
jgi:hypothetical protein